MRALWIVLLFAAGHAAAQEGRGASDEEARTVAYIADCLVAGLPEDWKAAAVEINLEHPYDKTGGVRYVFTNEENARPSQPFEPCDVKKPATALLELRDRLPPAQQGWIGAQLSLMRDGRFGIRYGFPKPAAKPKAKAKP